MDRSLPEAAAAAACARAASRGRLEPLCERCHRQALDKVAGEIAAQAPRARRARSGGIQPPPVAPTEAGPPKREAQPARRATRPRRISEELLAEARRLYGLGLSLRAVAETLVDQTGYRNARSAEAALRFHFKQRGWPLCSHAEGQRARRARSTSRTDGRARAA